MNKIEIEGDLPSGIDKDSVKVLSDNILKKEAHNVAYELCIKLVDSLEMIELNRLYRGKNESTDVLTFLGDELFLSDRTLRVCDIVIDINQLNIQKDKNTLSEEFWQVLIHGLLHAAGYDHIKTSDKRTMEDAEENYRRLIKDGAYDGS